MSEVRDAPVSEPILHAHSREEGARQEAHSGRIVRLIAFFAALALAIAFIWAEGPSR